MVGWWVGGGRVVEPNYLTYHGEGLHQGVVRHVDRVPAEPDQCRLGCEVGEVGFDPLVGGVLVVEVRDLEPAAGHEVRGRQRAHDVVGEGGRLGGGFGDVDLLSSR